MSCLLLDPLDSELRGWRGHGRDHPGLFVKAASLLCDSQTENSNLPSSLTGPPDEEPDAWKDYSLNACADSLYGGH
jgi:hypothetical protein